KKLILVVLLHFDELNNLVGHRIGKNSGGMPGSQSKFRVIPIARKARITPKSVFNRLRVHHVMANATIEPQSFISIDPAGKISLRLLPLLLRPLRLLSDQPCSGSRAWCGSLRS